ncbi:MAG: TetR/AcrR family transcriptional regulator [Candidatus Ornithospirochaeta sp.]
MPKALSQKEKEIIRERLRKTAGSLMLKNGIRHTTVDALAKGAMIPKGTFYLFYESKEELLFEVLEMEHKSLDEEILEKAGEIDPSSMGCDEAVSLVFSFFLAQEKHPLLAAITEEDVALLFQKLPEDRVKKHLEDDEKMTRDLMTILPIKECIRTETVTSALHSIYFSMLHMKEKGEEYKETLLLLIRGVMMQII